MQRKEQNVDLVQRKQREWRRSLDNGYVVVFCFLVCHHELDPFFRSMHHHHLMKTRMISFPRDHKMIYLYQNALRLRYQIVVREATARAQIRDLLVPQENVRRLRLSESVIFVFFVAYTVLPCFALRCLILGILHYLSSYIASDSSHSTLEHITPIIYDLTFPHDVFCSPHSIVALFLRLSRLATTYHENINMSNAGGDFNQFSLQLVSKLVLSWSVLIIRQR